MKNKKIILGLSATGCLMAAVVLAASTSTEGIPFAPSITLPGSDFVKANVTMIVGPETLGNYINSIYKAGGMLAGVAAMFMLVYAGWVWLFAAGNSGKISQAQDTIRMTLIGLAFLFGGYLLLSLISTNLVKFKSLEIKKPTFHTPDEVFCQEEQINHLCGEIFELNFSDINTKEERHIKCRGFRCENANENCQSLEMVHDKSMYVKKCPMSAQSCSCRNVNDSPFPPGTGGYQIRP